MMEATLIGESTRMERIWTDRFRRTGTYHMLVIDGLHITVLAAFLLFLLRLCFLPEMHRACDHRLRRLALRSGLRHGMPRAIRAAGGFTLYVVARYFYRRGRLMNLLAAIAIVYLVWDPEPALRGRLSAIFPGRRGHRLARHAALGGDVATLPPRPRRHQ